jgi:hypothetical protein
MLTPSDTLSLAAATLALTAIAMNVMHHKHHIRPRCEIQWIDQGHYIAALLRNAGMTAITVKSVVYSDGERAISRLVGGAVDNFVEYTIPTGGQVALLELRPADDSARATLRRALVGVEILVVYADGRGKGRYIARGTGS